MILGELGSIFSDTLFTQTAHNRTIDIHLSDLTHVRGTFFTEFKGLSSLVRDHSGSTTIREGELSSESTTVHTSMMYQKGTRAVKPIVYFILG